MRDRSRSTASVAVARRRPATLAVAALASLVVVGGVAGCQSGETAAPRPSSSGSVVPSSVAPPPAAMLAVTPADNSAAVGLDQPVTVTAEGGTLTTVTVTEAGGGTLAGSLAASGDSWTSAGALKAATTYEVSAAAVNSDGVPTTLTSTFTTLTPTKVLGTKIAPLEDETVGVGMPIVIYFTAPVADRAAVERRLSVEASIPVEGAWHWYSDTEVHYRPKQYWPVGDNVTVNADVAGVDAGKGVWGESDHTAHFHVGDSHVTSVDAKTDVMTVRVNGKVVKTAPVSLGRDKYPTTSGIHVVLAKTPSVVMDSATVGIPKGDPDYYYETVLWDVRISWSGEFVHSAPWSVGDQGHDNVSHGCVNAAPAVAEWFYNLSQRGDIVQIENTPRPLESGNGWTDWNMSWSDWLAGSALATGADIDHARQAEAAQGAAPTTPSAASAPVTPLVSSTPTSQASTSASPASPSATSSPASPSPASPSPTSPRSSSAPATPTGSPSG